MRKNEQINTGHANKDAAIHLLKLKHENHKTEVISFNQIPYCITSNEGNIGMHVLAT